MQFKNNPQKNIKMITKESSQKEVVDIARNNDVILIEAATGTGKSKMAIDVQKDVPSHDQVTRIAITKGISLPSFVRIAPKTLLIIAERAHKTNWIEEYKKHDCEYLLNNTTIICYASIHKYQTTKWDLIISDEFHHLSSNRLISLFTIEAKKYLFLSATAKKSIKDALYFMYRDLSIATYKISTKEAIDNKILPEPKIIIHELKMDNKKIIDQITVRKGNSNIIYCSFKNRFDIMKKYPKSTIVANCTQWEKYIYLNNRYDYFQKRFGFNNFNTLRAAVDRKKYLGECKTEYVQKVIMSEIPKSGRMICFCNSIDQANTLGGLNCTIHSKVKNPEKILDHFQSGKINSIYVVEMLREGMNLNNIQYGIIIQLDANELSFIQRSGRIMRSDNPIIHIVYYKFTRDEEFIKKVYENVDSKYIKIIKNQYYVL